MNRLLFLKSEPIYCLILKMVSFHTIPRLQLKPNFPFPVIETLATLSRINWISTACMYVFMSFSMKKSFINLLKLMVWELTLNEFAESWFWIISIMTSFENSGWLWIPKIWSPIANISNLVFSDEAKTTASGGIAETWNRCNGNF